MKYLVLVVLTGSLSACGDEMTPETGDPTMAAVSGSNQSAGVGEQLSDPIVVQVTQDGSPVSGTSVSWSVTQGGGSVSPASSATGSDGRASTTWTLGPAEGANSLQASATGVGGTVEFFATAEADTPPATAAVNVVDSSFDPSSSTVATGGTVTWTWTGSLDHNVTFSAGSNSTTKSSGTFSRDFPAAGSFDYQCTIHGASMSGTIVVENP